MAEDLGVTISRDEDFSEWYNQIVVKAGLADYSPIKGCMVIKPYGYAIWESIKDFLDKRIKDTGHENAYFPLFIPEEFFEMEKEHVEGFTPEVAWVTYGGDTPLERKLAIRPTSETIMYSMYAKWIRSWRDLPLLINQWANIVRWETKMTKLFIRTREFLWQEGHTAHATKEEAEEEVKKMLDVYREVMEDLLAIPTIPGYKTDNEKFAGAVYTMTVECLMADKKAMQAGTSHLLGQHFSKAFDIMFEDKDKEKKYVWQTSWGMTTRTVGTLVMVHSDNKGLILPPRAAPTKIVIVPIIFKDGKEEVIKRCKEVQDLLGKKYKVKLDDREGYTAGFKFNEWELKGIPIRIEIGPRDVKENKVVIVRRDNSEKIFLPMENLDLEVDKILENIQNNLFSNAKVFLEKYTFLPKNYTELCDILNNQKGMAKISWCERGCCEEKIKEETGATSCCIPLDQNGLDKKCIVCGQEAKKVILFAKHY